MNVGQSYNSAAYPSRPSDYITFSLLVKQLRVKTSYSKNLFLNYELKSVLLTNGEYMKISKMFTSPAMGIGRQDRA